MKKIFNKKSLLLIVILIIGIIPMIIKADSGFDSDYSGGDWSSDSSWSDSSSSSWDTDWDTDWNSSSSGYSSNGGSIYSEWSIAILILLFVYTLLILIQHIKTTKTTTRSFSVKIPPIEKGKTEQELAELLGGITYLEELKNQVFNTYKDIQIAWMNKDLEPVRNMLSDHMFNMYKTQVATLIAKKQTNMMEDITYDNCRVINVQNINGKQEVTVILEVTCKDYIVDKNNKVIRGKDTAINHYRYRLCFVRSVTKSTLDTCPNCGAGLENAASDKCEYCGTVITKESTNLAMTEKHMLEQFVINK